MRIAHRSAVIPVEGLRSLPCPCCRPSESFTCVRCRDVSSSPKCLRCRALGQHASTRVGRRPRATARVARSVGPRCQRSSTPARTERVMVAAERPIPKWQITDRVALASLGRRHPIPHSPVTARIVRATRRGSSIMGSCPTPASTLTVAWGRRSESALAYSAIGSSASFSDHATVTGHGNGSSGAMCQTSAERSLTTAQARESLANSTAWAGVNRSPWTAASRNPNLRKAADLNIRGKAGPKRPPRRPNAWLH
jgi:hypothetical protein